MSSSGVDEQPEETENETDNRKAKKKSHRVKKMKLNKAPSTTKKAKLVAIPGNSIIESANMIEEPTQDIKSNLAHPERAWGETKIFYLPLMPTDEDAKNAGIYKAYRCNFCQNLCDDQNLECKVCGKVYDVTCLYKRGYLESIDVPLKLEWTCSECSDLSKILKDEELRKIISVFDRLDFRRNCYVKLDDYIAAKKQLYHERNEKITDELLTEEKIKFKLTDKDSNGYITWNEYLDFETSEILSKMNKVELSNNLTIKELLRIKTEFLSYDKEKVEMITQEDAKNCYIKYIDKLSTAKTIWPEFLRKMTILIIFDRINYPVFKGKSFKLKKNRFLALRNRLGKRTKFNDIKKSKSPNSNRPPSNSTSTDYPDYLSDTNSQASGISFLENPLSDLIKPKEKKEEMTNNFIDTSQIMSENMELEHIHFHKPSEFGSYNFIIRSKRVDFENNDTKKQKGKTFIGSDDDEEIRVKFETGNQLKPASYYFGNSNSKKANHSQSLNKLNGNYDTALNAYNQINQISVREKNFYNTYQIPRINNGNDATSNYIKNIYQQNNPFINTIENSNFNYVNESFNCMSLNKFQTEKNKFNSNSYNNFVYNKVSSDIYSKFGRSKPRMGYPQTIKNAHGINGQSNNLERLQESISDSKIKSELNLPANKDFFLPKIF